MNRTITHELDRYCSQVIAVQDKESQYQNIISKLTKTIAELEDVLKI
ncbi:MAG TPA: hypothetical protein VFV86_00940 [Nitrososphaeraceae archaeon]|nr:hypothetical protein [Nitrososphaeraceae archaeon]